MDGNLASALLQKIEQQQPEYSMDSDYVFLCGIMWCNYGSQEAGRELLRATDSSDRNTKALAWAMLAKGMTQLRKRASN